MYSNRGLSILVQRSVEPIPIYEPEITTDDMRTVEEAIKSGWVSSKGSFIDEFERKFASYIGKRYGVSTSSGTTALHLALLALGIGKDDNVLVPSLTFVSPVNAILYCGAVPKFIDIDPENWGIEPECIEKAIDSKTRAIIAIHLYGNPCKIEQIQEIANRHNIPLIEDCAEAHGAEYRHKKVGLFGVISCFSFYGNKMITTGEGGMCLTDDPLIMEKMRVLRDHGMSQSKKYWHDMVGYNYRMTNLQAALGVSQLKRIDDLIERKRRIASLYSEFLSNNPNITSHHDVHEDKRTFWLYTVLINGLDKEEFRDMTIDSLRKIRIETRPFFYPVHTMPTYSKYQKEKMTYTDSIWFRGISLPSGPLLKEDQIELVSSALSDLCSKVTR